jgi:hypothetical protein
MLPAYSEGSLVRNPVEKPKILTHDFNDFPQYVNENAETGP